jgi:4-hydroxybenzoate polyprenyltransferase
MFLNYLRLIRPQAAAFTGIVIIIGRVIMNQQIPIFDFFVLFLIGILSHIFIFVLNEYWDIQVDTTSKHLKEKPLVSGVLPKHHALIIALFVGVCVYGIVILVYPSFFPLLFLTLALLSGGIYDIVGKKIPGSDVLIAGGCFFGCLLGASTISPYFINLVYILSVAIYVYILFSNAIIGGLKDADHDSLAGAKTTATRMGVIVKNGKISIPKKFLVVALTLEIIYVGLIIFASFQPGINLVQSGEYLILVLLILLMIILFSSFSKFIHSKDFHKQQLNRLFGINMITAYSMAPLVLLPLVGLENTLILLLLPPIWLLIVNVILYGKPMQPQV